MGKDLKDEFLDELKNIKLEEKMYEKTSEINKFAFSEELKMERLLASQNLDQNITLDKLFNTLKESKSMMI